MNYPALGRFVVRFGVVCFAVGSFFFALKEGLQAYGAMTKPETTESSSKIVMPPPDATKETAEEFIGHWFFIGDGENQYDRLERMKGIVTQRLQSRMQELDLLVASNQEVHRAETTAAEWIEEGTRALVEVKVTFKNGQTQYLNVPVVTGGGKSDRSRWLVDGIPGIQPEPARKEPKDLKKPDVEDPKKLESDLDAFFSAWMAGKDVSRFTDKKLPQANLLNELDAEYQDVTLTPAGDKPIQYIATVSLKGPKGSPIHQEYLVTLHQEGQTWYVDDIQ